MGCGRSPRYVWALPSGSPWAWVGLGSAALLSFLLTVIVLAASKTAWLVLKRRHDQVTYQLADDPGLAEAFLAELREHAERERLGVRFTVEPPGGA